MGDDPQRFTCRGFCLGSADRDMRIGTRGGDRILGRLGRDRIRGRAGVNCGKGRDIARVDRVDRVKGCERVRRR